MTLGKNIFKKAAMGVFLFQLGNSLCSGMDEAYKEERGGVFWNAGLNSVSSWFHNTFTQIEHFIGTQQEVRVKSQLSLLGLPADIWNLILKPKYLSSDFYEKVYDCAQYGSFIQVCKASNQFVKYQLDVLFNEYIQRGLPPLVFHFDLYKPIEPYIKKGISCCLSELKNRNMSDKITFNGIKGPDFKAFTSFLNTTKILEIKSPGPLIIRPLVGLLEKSRAILTVNLTIDLDEKSWVINGDKMFDDLAYLSKDDRLKKMFTGEKMVKGDLNGMQINTIAQIQPSSFNSDWGHQRHPNRVVLDSQISKNNKSDDNRFTLSGISIDDFPNPTVPFIKNNTGILGRVDRGDEDQLRSRFDDLVAIERLFEEIHQTTLQSIKREGDRTELSSNCGLDFDPVKQNAVIKKMKSTIVNNIVEACQSNNPESDAEVMRDLILSALCQIPFSVSQLQTLLDFIQVGSIRNFEDLEEALNRFRTEK